MTNPNILDDFQEATISLQLRRFGYLLIIGYLLLIGFIFYTADDTLFEEFLLLLGSIITIFYNYNRLNDHKTTLLIQLAFSISILMAIFLMFISGFLIAVETKFRTDALLHLAPIFCLGFVQLCYCIKSISKDHFQATNA